MGTFGGDSQPTIPSSLGAELMQEHCWTRQGLEALVPPLARLSSATQVTSLPLKVPDLHTLLLAGAAFCLLLNSQFISTLHVCLLLQGRRQYGSLSPPQH